MITVSSEFENKLKNQNTPLFDKEINVNLIVATTEAKGFGTGAFGTGAFGSPTLVETPTNFNISDYIKNLPTITESINIETEQKQGKSNNISLMLDNSTGYFSELKNTSLFYNRKYMTRPVTVDIGLKDLPNEFIRQFSGFIKKLTLKQEKATLQLVDKYKEFLDNEMKTKEDASDTTSDTYLVEATGKDVSWWIWALLTGYDYDTNTKLSWYETSGKLDYTQSTSNNDINYTRYLESKTNTDNIIFNNTVGFYDNETIAEAIAEVIKVSFGSTFFSTNTGKFQWRTFAPKWLATDIPELDDSITAKNLTDVSYEVDEKYIYNQVIIKYNWNSTTEKYDDYYVLVDSTSVDLYGVKSLTIESKLLDNSVNAEDLADRIVARFGRGMSFVTANTTLENMTYELTDFIKITDKSTGLENARYEIIGLTKNYEAKKGSIKCYNAEVYDLGDFNWGFYWNTNADGNGNGNDGGVEYVSPTDYDDDNYNAQSFGWFSGDTEAENLGYVYYY